MLAHNGTLANTSLLNWFFIVHPLLGHDENTAPLHLLLKARQEFFVRFLGGFLEMNHMIFGGYER